MDPITFVVTINSFNVSVCSFLYFHYHNDKQHFVLFLCVSQHPKSLHVSKVSIIEYCWQVQILIILLALVFVV
jgi:hypothetical protein